MDIIFIPYVISVQNTFLKFQETLKDYLIREINLDTNYKPSFVLPQYEKIKWFKSHSGGIL